MMHDAEAAQGSTTHSSLRIRHKPRYSELPRTDTGSSKRSRVLRPLRELHPRPTAHATGRQNSDVGESPDEQRRQRRFRRRSADRPALAWRRSRELLRWVPRCMVHCDRRRRSSSWTRVPHTELHLRELAAGDDALVPWSQLGNREVECALGLVRRVHHQGGWGRGYFFLLESRVGEEQKLENKLFLDASQGRGGTGPVAARHAILPGRQHQLPDHRGLAEDAPELVSRVLRRYYSRERESLALRPRAASHVPFPCGECSQRAFLPALPERLATVVRADRYWWWSPRPPASALRAHHCSCRTHRLPDRFCTVG